MRVLHLNAGTENGGGMYHILSLLSQFKRGEVVLGLFEKGEMYQRAKEMNIETMLFNQKGQKDLTILPSLYQYIKRNHFTYVHTHGPRATLFMAFLKRYISQPLLTTIHSNPCDDFMGRGIKGKVCFHLFKWSFKAVDHFIVVSSAFSNLMHDQFNIPKTKISTILNGINFETQLEPYNKEEFGFVKSDFIILMVARLEPVKQPLLAAKAVEQVIKKYSQVRFIIVGEGTYKNRLQNYIIEHNLEEHIQLLGYRTDVDKIIPLADLVLLTSKSESFPLTLLEAARSKVPIVTTDVGDVKKLIPNPNFGWVVKKQDSNSIAQTIEEVIMVYQNKSLRKYGLNLYNYASSNFSMKHFYDSVRQIYVKFF